MKEFELVYDPNGEESLCLFNNVDIQTLADPLIIQREEALSEGEELFSRKKSEVVEHEDEQYVQLREQEQEPLVITDSESRVYAGKLQDMSMNSGTYFALINTGTHLRLIPINKWYRFMQRNQFSDGDLEELEKRLGVEEKEEERDESDNEIDFEPTFDDDEGIDSVVVVERKKELTKAGEKLRSIVDNTEGEDRKKASQEEKIEEVAEESQKRQKADTNVLTKEKIKNIVGTDNITAKELIKRINNEYPLGQFEKKLIREFIHESCILAGVTPSGEKLFKVKKK